MKTLNSEIEDLYEIFVKRNTDRMRIHEAEIDENNTKAMITAMDLYRNGVESFFLEKKDMLTEEEADKKHEELQKLAYEQVTHCRLLYIMN